MVLVEGSTQEFVCRDEGVCHRWSHEVEGDPSDVDESVPFVFGEIGMCGDGGLKRSMKIFAILEFGL